MKRSWRSIVVFPLLVVLVPWAVFGACCEYTVDRLMTWRAS